MGGQDIVLSFERSVLSKLAPQLINLTLPFLQFTVPHHLQSCTTMPFS